MARKRLCVSCSRRGSGRSTLGLTQQMPHIPASPRNSLCLGPLTAKTGGQFYSSGPWLWSFSKCS